MQDTNLKVSPYFDDFDRSKNYHKVLFKPGYSVQTRELNNLQSTLQNQVERFGQHIFKDGSVVIPGNIGYNLQYTAVLVQNLINGIRVEEYRSSLVGTTIKGSSSGVKAEIIDTISEEDSEKNIITLYVKYTAGGFFEDDIQLNKFKNNEILIRESDGIPIAVTTVQNATAYTGSVAYINSGVYFIKGFFVEVPTQRIILDQYTNQPSYKVGLVVNESIVTSEDDESLFDNALGSTNYSAPGADRLKISTELTKQNLLLTDDSNFIELLRLEEGSAVKLVEFSAYSELEKNLARRTFDESGNYTLDQYSIKIREALFDGENNGVYFTNQLIPDGRTILDRDPTEDEDTSINGNDYYALEISEGKAYVKGFEVINTKKQYILAEKPRKSSSLNNQGIFLNIGQYFNLDPNQTISGSVNFNSPLILKDVDNQIVGEAKALGLTFGYKLYITDLTVYTTLTLSTSSHSLQSGDFITGSTSGATGVVESFSGQNVILRQVTGSFLPSEAIQSSRVDYTSPVTISTINVPKLENVRKIQRISGSNTVFTSFVKLDPVPISGSSFSVNGTTFTGTGTKFNSEVFAKSKLRIGSSDVEVSTVTNASTIVLTSPTNLTNGIYYNVSKLTCKLYSSNNGLSIKTSSYPVKSTTDFSYDISKTEQYTVLNGGFTISRPLTESIEASTVIVTSATALLTPVITQTSGNVVSVSGLDPQNGSVVNVFYKLRLSNASPRKKISVPYQKLIVDLFKNSNNTKYGTRLIDREWSLKFPDVYKIHAIHEATSAQIQAVDMFDSIVLNNSDKIVVGDVIVAGNIRARIIEISSTNLKIKYLSDDKFVQGSNLAIKVEVSTNASIIGRFVKQSTYGAYKDISSNFSLVKNDTEDFYRVSKLVRKLNKPYPVNKIIVVFDYLKHEDLSNDFYVADSFTNLEYSEVPTSYNGVSYSDLVDFRYYIAPSTGSNGGSGTLSDPYRETQSAFDFKLNQIQSSTKFAYPQKLVTLDYDFYLGRIDKVYLNETGYASIIKGADSINPKLPLTNDTGLLLGTISLPPYLKKVSDASIKLENTKGYTMKDIGLLDERLTNVETYTSLNLLEINTNTLNILDDEGKNRFKNGFIVDKFNTVTIADITNPDYSISIDTNNYLARPYPYVNNVDFVYSNTEGATKKTGDLITLPYTDVVYISQSFASRVENINPFEIVNWVGNITLTPKKDVWYDTVRTMGETQTIDLEGPIRFLFDQSGAAGDQWGSWTTTRSERTNGGTNNFQSRTGVNNRIDVTEQTINTGDTINSIVDLRFVRSSIIDLLGTSLKPNTNFNFYINEINATEFLYPKIITNISGVNKKFIVGETVELFPLPPLLFDIPADSFQVLPTDFNTITATVVDPYNFTSNKDLIGNNFALNQTSQTIEYSQNTTILAIDKISTTNLNLINPTLLGQRFNIRGMTSGAIGTTQVPQKVISNEIGTIHAFVTIPPQKFETGILTFTISDKPGDIFAIGYTSSSASTSYLTEGTQVNVTSNIVSVSVPEVVTTPISQNRTVFVADPVQAPGGRDPLAQSFFIDTEGGIFATSIDLYFYTKDNIVPISVDIRTVENGYPTSTVVPYSSVTVNASDVKISSDASIPTTFTFPSPVYLSDKTDYCFVVKAVSQNYYIWVSRLGEIDVTNNNAIDKQPYIGVLFKSANQSTWTPDQYEDIKFTLNRAKFTTNTTVPAVLYNKPIPPVKLQPESLRFNQDSTTITVFQPNHGMHGTQNYVILNDVVSDQPNSLLGATISNTALTLTLNDLRNQSINYNSFTTWTKVNNASISSTNPGYIKINNEIIAYSEITSDNVFTVQQRGALGTIAAQHLSGSIVKCYNLNGMNLDSINTTHKILNVLNIDEYQIVNQNKANFTISGGGPNAYATRNIPYEILNPQINILTLPDTDSTLVLDSITGTSIGNTSQVSFLLKDGETISNKTENELSSPRLVASDINAKKYLNGVKGSMKLMINMSTTKDTISPVLDLIGSSIITISNRINKELTDSGNIDISSELLPIGGLHPAYITKKVTLEKSASSVRVLFDAIRRQGVDIKVFVKIKGDSALGSFGDMNYTEIPVESYPVSQTENEYRSFEYEIRGLQEFKEWSIKVIMIGNDQSNIPKIKNFRAIALAI